MTDGGDINASDERKVFGVQLPRLHDVPVAGTPIDYEDNYSGRHPRLHKLAVRFTSPTQVISRRQLRAIQVLGSTGWVFKGIVYAIIGGLSCQSAVGDSDEYASASPQGAFILVGSNTVGPELLVVLTIGVLVYAAWRFWEAAVGQGSDAAYGAFKNFFKFRLSPFVSGCVYTAYAYFVTTLIPKSRDEKYNADRNSSFPNNWHNSTAGKVGLVFFGIAFVAATLVQLEATFTRSFHVTLRNNMPAWFRWVVLVSGHLGHLARGAVFMFVAVLFFRTVGGEVAEGRTTVGDALEQLRGHPAGETVLFLMGFGLIIYGLFAVLCGLYARQFPTPPPSGHRHQPSRASVQASEQDAEEVRPSTNGVPPTLPESPISIQIDEGQGHGVEAPSVLLHTGVPAKSSVKGEEDGRPPFDALSSQEGPKAKMLSGHLPSSAEA